MKVVRFGSRQDLPAYFDMACRFRLPKAAWYGRAFRIGDRAAAHVWVGNWRSMNPNRRLVVVEDSCMPEAVHSRFLPASWLFAGMVDEIWTAERRGELLPRPPGEPIYHVTMWRIWLWIRRNGTFVPTIRPPESVFRSADAKMRKLGIPPRFVTIQPLFDAIYDTHRNGSLNWWGDVCGKLASVFPVVILGDVGNSGKLTAPPGAYPLWAEGLTPLESLAVVYRSAAHVGGATGLTLWAPIFRVPTLAAYAHWELRANGSTDTRPISFGAPVIWTPLNGDPAGLVEETRNIWSGKAVEKGALHASAS